MDQKEYHFGGKKYFQRPLVLGQLRVLLPILKNIEIKEHGSAETIVKAFGDKIGQALAIVLIEEDLDPSVALERIEDRAKEIEFSIPIETMIEAIEDFFECNPVSSVIDRFREMITVVTAQIREKPRTSSKPSGDSPKETSLKGKRSSGA